MIAERLRAGGLTILNDVVLNQVLVRVGDGRRTAALIAAVQDDGRIWCGPTQWDGETAMRISVSSWKTDLADAALAADVIVELAGALAELDLDQENPVAPPGEKEHALHVSDRWFLKIDGIDGDSTSVQHKGEIDVQSWSWGVTQTGSSGGGGGGGGAGRAVFQDFHFVSRISKASPALFLACATGQHHKDATLTGERAGSAKGGDLPAVQAERRARHERSTQRHRRR